MLNFGDSKPRVKEGVRAPGAPPDPHLNALFIFDAVCPVKYCEFSSDFVVNVAQMSLNWTELAHDWNIHDINNDINEEISSSRTALLTRMPSSRMRTALPPGNHTCPQATTHTPLATTHAPSNHACPPRNHTPPPTMHGPLWTDRHL